VLVWDVVCVAVSDAVVKEPPCDVKSSSTFVPLSVIVLLIDPKPFPEAVTVIVPELGIGNAYPPDEDVIA